MTTAATIPVEKRTVAKALKTFTFVKSLGSAESKQACAATMLAWLRGDAWTDHPECAHPLICDLVIRANDAPETTTEQQEALVWAGVDGMLDTWWIPAEVILSALSIDRESEVPSHYDRTLMMLTLISEWKAGPKERPNLADAYLAGANLTRANLTGAYLTGAYLADANLTRANLTGANLTGAYLAGAYLTRANLTGANLTGAYLTGAYLTGAYLTGAYLADAFGTPSTGVPAGWEINKFGLYVKKAS